MPKLEFFLPSKNTTDTNEYVTYCNNHAEIIRYHHTKFCCQSEQVPRIRASV